MNDQHTNLEKDDYTFLREKITERPVNKRKVIKQSLLTITLAVTFALVACFIFFFFERGALSGYSKEQEAQKVSLTLHETTEEIMPEDMIKDEQLPDEADPFDEENTTAIADAIAAYEPDVDDYQGIYNKMRAISKEAEKSLVTVVGIQDKKSWLNSPMENKMQSTGVILEDNGTDLLILTDSKVIKNASDIAVTLNKNEVLSASILSSDPYTNLAVISVPLANISNSTKEAIVYAPLGSSSATKPGDVIIAVGDPLGYGESVGYGIVTASGMEINSADKNFSLITTNIYGSVNGNGVLVNKNGKIVGFITSAYNKKEFSNMVSALAVSELNKYVEDLCNNVKRPHMGVYVTNVTSMAKEYYKVPSGAFITDIKLDSPAMNSGLHKGDVITAINDAVIFGVSDFERELNSFKPGDDIVVSVMRANGDTYVNISIKVTLSE